MTADMVNRKWVCVDGQHTISQHPPPLRVAYRGGCRVVQYEVQCHYCAERHWKDLPEVVLPAEESA